MKIYKITKHNHIEPVLLFIGYMFFSAIGCYLLYRFKMHFSNLDLIIKLYTIAMTGKLVPSVLIHLNHYLINRNVILQYDALHGEFIYSQFENIRKFGHLDIEKITLYKSWPLAKGRSAILIWDSYNYAVVELKDGTVIKLSSLVVNELDKVVNFDNLEIKKTLYAWMN